MMSNKDEEIYKMFEEEYLEISLAHCLKGLIVKEIRKFIEALKLELEATEFTTEISKDINDAGTLLIRILFAFDFKHKTVEVTLAESLVLANMLYCSITFYHDFPLPDVHLMNEYQKFFNTLKDTLKILDESDIDRYRRFIRSQKIQSLGIQN